MIILGIDPGTAETGFGVIESRSKKVSLLAYGSIKTSKDETQAVRLDLIYKEVLALIRQHQPEILAIESLFFNINAKSASAVGQAMGVIKLAAARKKVKVIEYPPLRIKRKLTGNGRAEKKEIQSKVRRFLKIRKLPRPSHAADALAVAICHWQETSLK